MELRDKTVVLTGANGGLGQELARQLADAGARLVLVDLDQDSLAKIAGRLGTAKTRHCYRGVDLSSENGLTDLANFCRELPSGIDVLINSAGLNRFALLEDSEFDATSKLMTVNLVAPIMLTSMLLPLLRSKEEALVANIGSALGAIGNPGYSSYCASKAGLARFSETMRRELSDTNVRVLHLNPRVISTTMNSESVNDLNRQLGNKSDSPEKIARILLGKIRNDQFGDHNVGWPERLFIRINALLPALVDRNFYKNLPLIKAAASHEGTRIKAADHNDLITVLEATQN